MSPLFSLCFPPLFSPFVFPLCFPPLFSPFVFPLCFPPLFSPFVFPFDYIVSEYVCYYHECRPHQGLDNKLLPLPRGRPDEDDESLPFDPATIRCEHRLGGILKHYYRSAA